MAMNKAEKKKFEQLQTFISLSWPNYVEPKRIELPYGSPMRQGWFSNHYSMVVSLGESDAHHHQRDISYTGARSREAGVMYETKLEAIQAMRWKASKEYAKKLRDIDAMIERELESIASIRT